MPDFTKIPQSDKEYKNLRIYHILRERGEVSRADLTSITKINAVSISNYINAYMKKGLIIEREIGASSGGRPPILLELNKEDAFTIGIHVDEFFIKGIVINLTVDQVKIDERKIESTDLKDSIRQVINSLKEGIDKEKIKGIALSVEHPGVDSQKIAITIENELNMIVYTGIPSMAAAYAESLYGNNIYENTFLYSYKDLGECVFFENFGFYTSEEEGIANCEYLRPWRGDMSIENSARRIIKEGAKTEIINMASSATGKVTDIDVFSAARENDTVAIEVLEFAGLNLGVRLAYLVNVFKPKKLILGGGVEKSGNHFIAPVKKSIQRLALEDISGKVEVAYASLANEYAVATGAAALVIRELFMGV